MLRADSYEASARFSVYVLPQSAMPHGSSIVEQEHQPAQRSQSCRVDKEPRQRPVSPHGTERLPLQHHLAHGLDAERGGQESGQRLYPGGIPLQGDQHPVQDEDQPAEQMRNRADLGKRQGQAADQQGKTNDIDHRQGRWQQTCRTQGDADTQPPGHQDADDDRDQHSFKDKSQQATHQQRRGRERAEVHLLERATVDLFKQVTYQLEDGEVEKREGQESQQRGRYQRSLDRAIANDELQERVEGDKGEDFQQHNGAMPPQQPQAFLGFVQYRAGRRHNPQTTSSRCSSLTCLWLREMESGGG